jgi:CRISPR-associated protein, Cmr4 family
MYKERAILTFYSETPIHMGAGQSVSYVDLPVQRERHTSFPILWSSGIKGVVRDLALRVWNDKDKVETIFGPENGSSDFASCISITDAKILLYPVRSLKGVFAWITCPFVLKRFKEDLKAAGINFEKEFEKEIEILDDEKIGISQNSKLKINNDEVVLEEFVFKVDNTQFQNVSDLANFLKKFLPDNSLIQSLENHLAIVSDNVFKDFVNYAVEVRTRIRIDQARGTVKEGALFTEELIPSESIFYSLVFITDPFKQNANIKDAKGVISEINSLLAENSLLQLGGDETTGKGYVRVKFYSENQKGGLQ